MRAGPGLSGQSVRPPDRHRRWLSDPELRDKVVSLVREVQNSYSPNLQPTSGLAPSDPDTPGSVPNRALSAAHQDLTAVCPNSLVIESFMLFPEWAGALAREGENWRYVPNNHGIRSISISCAPPGDLDARHRQYISLGAQSRGPDFSFQWCGSAAKMSGIVTYSRNAVVDFVEAACKDGSGARVERPRWARDLVLS